MREVMQLQTGHVHTDRNILMAPQVVQALEYYLGITYIPDSEVVDRLLGVPTQLLHLAVAVSCWGRAGSCQPTTTDTELLGNKGGTPPYNPALACSLGGPSTHFPGFGQHQEQGNCPPLLVPRCRARLAPCCCLCWPIPRCGPSDVMARPAHACLPGILQLLLGCPCTPACPLHV